MDPEIRQIACVQESLSPAQDAYLKGMSVDTALIIMAVFLDIEAVFNNAHISAIVNTLHKIGFVD